MAHRLARYMRRNHLALVALFFALSGGFAWGLATGSVNSREIKNGTVRGIDVRNNGLTGADIRSLRARDLRCPEGTQRTGPVCYEPLPRFPVPWLSAIRDCGESGLQLPTIPEAYLMAADRPAPPQDRQFWTSTPSDQENASPDAFRIVLETDGDIQIQSAPAATNTSYSCVTPLAG